MKIVSSLHVKVKLTQFGLICKDPERLEDGACVLGLDVHGKQGSLRWRCGATLPGVPDALTKRGVFSLCGMLVGHLPVCRWLCIVTWVKCRKGKLGVGSTWRRLAMNITHYGSQHFLMFIDSRPSRFAVWRPLLCQDSTSIIC